MTPLSRSKGVKPKDKKKKQIKRANHERYRCMDVSYMWMFEYIFVCMSNHLLIYNHTCENKVTYYVKCYSIVDMVSIVLCESLNEYYFFLDLRFIPSGVNRDFWSPNLASFDLINLFICLKI